MKRPLRRHVLAIDIGGTRVKLKVSNRSAVRVFDSSKSMTPRQMMRTVRAMTKDWRFDLVSLGYPGIVVDGRIVAEPFNLGVGWTRFDFEAHFKRPVRITNDAVMQGMGAYHGGRMLYLSFGTALGAVAILDSQVHPLELAYIPFNKRASIQASLGEDARCRLGGTLWSRKAIAVVKHLKELLGVQEVIIGGGNAVRLKRLPPYARIADDKVAFSGGVKIWKRRTRNR